MKKEKFHIEFIMGNVSQSILWKMVSHVEGLSEWFADEVDINEESGVYTFTWNGADNVADILSIKPMNVIRLRWRDDEDEEAYFEFALYKLELSGDITLEITDFAEPDEKSDAIALWENQVDQMKRKLGI